MCLVRRFTYIHSDDRREIREDRRRCSLAPIGGLCHNVEYKENGAARIIEVQPSTDLSASSSRVTAADPRFYPLSRRASKRSSNDRSPKQSNNKRSSMENPPSPSSPRPSDRTYVSRAPTPPPRMSRPGKHVSFDEYEDLARTVGPDGTAFYSGPPSLNMPRATINERPSLDRRSSISSLTNEVDDTEPPKRRSSMKRPRKPSGLEVPSNAGTSSAGLSNLPRFGRPRQDSAADLPFPDVRANAARDEDVRQARIMKASLEETDRRQRNRMSRETGYPSSQESSRERRDRNRREAEAALAGEHVSDREDEIERERKRRLAAEMAQVERERLAAEERRRSQQRALAPSSSALGHTYTTAPTSGPSRKLPSAREFTPMSAPTLESRTPRYHVQIHHYPDKRHEDPLARLGEQVIYQAQSREAGPSNRLDEAIGGIRGMNLRDLNDDEDERDSAIDSGVSRTEGKRYRKEQRRRRREREYND